MRTKDNDAMKCEMALVLLVDDDPLLIKLLVEVVGTAGHTALTASNGHEALILARYHTPALIVCDVLMSEMNGLQLLSAIRAEPTLATTLVIMMSASFQPEQRRFHAPTVILPKPFDMAVIDSFLAILPST